MHRHNGPPLAVLRAALGARAPPGRVLGSPSAGTVVLPEAPLEVIRLAHVRPLITQIRRLRTAMAPAEEGEDVHHRLLYLLCCRFPRLPCSGRHKVQVAVEHGVRASSFVPWQPPCPRRGQAPALP
eukprot:scaffold4863_cov158-Pinguiococcus_pyrenoidosus.AAC.3